MAELQQLNGSHFRSTLRQWILCFVVCNFNVDIGPEIEYVYPPDTPFSTTDLSFICFNSFPERHDGEITEDTYFHFTLKNNSPDINLSSPSPPYGSADLFHGVSVFRQEFDHMTKRRFNQKSLVLISSHDYAALFMNLLRVVVSGSTIGDPTRLEVACSQIEKWAPPRIGKQELPFIGGTIILDIPPYPSFPLTGSPSPFSAVSSLLTQVSAHEPTESWPSLLPLLPSPASLYLLYERLILGDPIIILGQNPQHVSAMARALVDLIRPVPFAGLVREYLPMQSTSGAGEHALFDPDTRESFVLGITNPFLLQRFSNPSSTLSHHTPYILPLTSPTPPSPQSPPSRHTSFLHPSRSLRGHRSSTSASSAHSASSSSSHSSRIDVPGLALQSQPRPAHCLKSDRAFLAQLASDEHGGNGAALAVRRHFADLTAKLLAPVTRHLAAIVPSGSSSTSTSGEKKPPATAVAPPSAAALTQTFGTAAFVKSLAAQSSPAPFVGQTAHGRHKARDAFYQRFCTSRNFAAWLELRRDTERQAGAGLL